MSQDTADARQQAIALVRDYYEAFNRGDWDGMLGLLAGDVVHDLNQGARERGRDAFAAFLARRDASYRERLEDVVVMASDDGVRVAAEHVVHGEYLRSESGLPKAHGQQYVLPGSTFFEVRDGRIARVSDHYNLQDWIAQVEAG